MIKLPQLPFGKIGRNLPFARLTGLVSSVGAILVSTAVILFIAWPKFTEVLALRSDNNKLGERVLKLAAKAESLASLNKSALDEQLGSAEQLLPSDKSVFSLVTQIERTAGSSGVVLNRIDTSPGILSGEEASSKSVTPKGAGGKEQIAPSVEVRLTMSGDYRSIMQFLRNVLSFSRVSEIGDLTLVSSSSESSLIRVSMVIRAYWQQLPSQLGSVESPIEDLTSEELALLDNVSFEVLAPTPVVPVVSTGKSDPFVPF